MQVFDFPYHSMHDEYPESSVTVRFGRGYMAATKPIGPDQIVTKLNFPVMFIFRNLTTGLIDRAVAPQFNILALQDFYEFHRMYEKFEYQHPTRGLTVWRFSKPLQMPDPAGADKMGGVPGVTGFSASQMNAFQLEIMLQP